MPWGTSSTSILPAAICSSLAVGVPGRTENAAISFFTWLFSARIWPRVAPASPRELQTSVSSFVPWSRRAQIRAVAKRCATPKPAMATVAPLGMSATACSGDATILFMASFPRRRLSPRWPHRLVVTERHRGPRPTRRRLGEAQHRPEMAQPTDRCVARDRPALQLLGCEFFRHVLELGLGHLAASDQPAPRLRERDPHEPA